MQLLGAIAGALCFLSFRQKTAVISHGFVLVVFPLFYISLSDYVFQFKKQQRQQKKIYLYPRKKPTIWTLHHSPQIFDHVSTLYNMRFRSLMHHNKYYITRHVVPPPHPHHPHPLFSPLAFQKTKNTLMGRVLSPYYMSRYVIYCRSHNYVNHTKCILYTVYYYIIKTKITSVNNKSVDCVI